MYNPRILEGDALHGPLATPNIHYVNSVPGAGKTYAALKVAAHTLHNGEHANYVLVYAAPTMRLLEQFRDELSRLATPRQMKHVHVVDSKDLGRSVVRRFHGLLNSYADANTVIKKVPDGSIILVTHECLRRVPLNLPGKDRVSLIFDEARQCMQESLRLRAPFQVIDHIRENHITIHETMKFVPSTARWSWTGDTRLDENKVREIWKLTHPNPVTRDVRKFMEFVNELRNGSQHVWVDMDTSEAAVQDFQVNVTLSPSRLFANYAKVLILSAFFEYSQMYHMLKRQECDIRTEDGKRRAGYLMRADRVFLVNVTDDLIDRKRVARIMRKRLQNATLTYILTDESLSKYHLTRGLIVDYVTPEHLKATSRSYTELYKREPHANGHPPSYKAFLRAIRTSAGHEYVPETANARRDLLMSLRPSKYSVVQYLSGRSVALQKAWLKASGLKHEPLLLCINARSAASDNSRLWESEGLEDLLNHGITDDRKKNVIEVPVISQGMNTWQHLNTAAFMATVKLSRDQITFLKNLLPDYDPDLDRTVDQCIQFIFRSALRDANSDTKCLLIVSDLKLARQVNDTLGAHMEVREPQDLIPSWERRSIAVHETSVDIEVKRKNDREYQKTAVYKEYRATYDKKRTVTDTGREYANLTATIHRRRQRLLKEPDNKSLIKEIEALTERRAKLKGKRK